MSTIGLENSPTLISPLHMVNQFLPAFPTFLSCPLKPTACPRWKLHHQGGCLTLTGYNRLPIGLIKLGGKPCLNLTSFVTRSVLDSIVICLQLTQTHSLTLILTSHIHWPRRLLNIVVFLGRMKPSGISIRMVSFKQCPRSGGGP